MTSDRLQRPRPLVVRLQNRLADALGVIAGVALVLMVGLLTVHILKRWLVGTGIGGANELSQYLMITLVYCALPMTLRDGVFLRVDLAVTRMTPRLKAVCAVITRVLSFGFMVLLTWRAWVLMAQSYERGLQSIGVLRAPLWVPQGIVVLGCAALTLQILVTIFYSDAARDASAQDEMLTELEEAEDALGRADTTTVDV